MNVESGLNVGSSGFVYIVEPSNMKMFFLSVYIFVNRDEPFVFVVIPAYAFVAAFVVTWCAPITMVLRRGGEAKIFTAVVGFYLIPMVYFKRWPFSRHSQPDNSVCEIVLFLDAYFNSSLVVQAPCSISDVNSLGKNFFPTKFASFGFVAKYFTHEFVCEVVVRILVSAGHWSCFSRFSSIIRRITSPTLMPRRFASSFSHFICGLVNTTDRWMMGMIVSYQTSVRSVCHGVKDFA